jgi:hypothetical protein
MASVRRGAGAFIKYFLPLLVLLVVVEVFLAGWGIFGIESGETVDDAGTLENHRGFGHMLGTFGGVLLLLSSLLWWPRDKRLLGWLLAAAVLLFVQTVLPVIGGQFAGALHAVNAFVVLGLLGSLTLSLWRRRDPTADQL